MTVFVHKAVSSPVHFRVQSMHATKAAQPQLGISTFEGDKVVDLVQMLS